MEESKENNHLLRLSVVSPASSLFEGEVHGVSIPSYDGLIGVLPKHAPVMGMLGYGILSFMDGGNHVELAIDGGFYEIVNNRVTILANSAEDIHKVNSAFLKEQYEKYLTTVAVGDEAIKEKNETLQGLRNRLKYVSR